MKAAGPNTGLGKEPAKVAFHALMVLHMLMEFLWHVCPMRGRSSLFLWLNDFA